MSVDPTLAKWINVAALLALGLALVLVITRQLGGGATSEGGPSREALAWTMISDGALIVDVRSQGEFDSGHLEGALLIPHDQTSARLAEFGEDLNRPIVVYCRSGNRAGTTQKVLEAAGFTNVVNGGGYSGLMKAKPSGD